MKTDKRVAVYVDAAILERLKVFIATRRGLTLGSVTDEAIASYLDKKEAK